jgi:demethoxyubiquinone hydroxylase (CLK1/Coq7/Cat5 family)
MMVPWLGPKRRLGVAEANQSAPTTMTTTKSTERIISELVGRTIRYIALDSQQTNNGVRVFKIDQVNRVAVSKKGVRYAVVRAWDIDDRGEQKFRSLHLAGIDLVV